MTELLSSWQFWAGIGALVATVTFLMLASVHEDASKDALDDGADGFRGSFGGDQGASDE
jgi:hypothetical protein